MGLVRWLEEQQKREGLVGYAFAATLSIDQSSWSLFRRGLRSGHSYLLVCGALCKYPDQWQAIFQAVAEDCRSLKMVA